MKKMVVRRVRNVRPTASARLLPAEARLTKRAFVHKFDPTMLELGDLSAPCQEKDAIVAVFDLTGFTNFCNQVDAHLAIPRFLADFLDWLFHNIRNRITEREYEGGSALWAEIPIMVKFLGDGVLIIWNSRHMAEPSFCRVAATLFEITYSYRRDFYPRMSAIVNKPPAMLRCGLARGKIFSIGGGKDYVGHCINHASRLSHLGVSFCFPHRGFQVRDHMPPKYRNIFVPKSVSIRGVGDNELVWVVRSDFEYLSPENKALFSAPPGLGT